MDKKQYYARYSTDRKKQQLLKHHLSNISAMASKNASKIGLETLGKYLGLIHDIGKYSKEFQSYLELNNKTKRGAVIHSKNGAKFLYEKTKDTDKVSKFLKELLALCCMSHHTNLIDMLDLEGNNNFEKCLYDDNEKVPNFEDNINNIEEEIKHELGSVDIRQAKRELENIIKQIGREKETIPKYFYTGMVAKFLLSCLIDADHTDSANFELQEKSDCRQKGKYISWGAISERIEKHLEELNKTNKSDYEVKIIRKQISDDCLKAGQKFEKGCYKLEVPTGGGKTLASFRFAVEMAKRHKLDRIIYCIPYTTIIEQNAQTIRKIVEQEKNDMGKIVIEHHSNLSLKERGVTDEEIDQNEILTENWDAPIIFTTNVQILEVFFGKKTTNTRYLHQLANSVVIFDEIQTLPIKCVHIFNNAINFLVDVCKTTVVLCTATQPLLDKVDGKKGIIKLSNKPGIIDDAKKLFDDLTRVKIIPELNRIFQSEDIAKKAMELADKNSNCLVVCNTTKSAKGIFQIIQEDKNQKVYHLSARMTPIHRKWILRQVRKSLCDKKQIILVSTQVIEAGVDIDFNCGIRALAGLDSIIQTAGRINRNGNLKDMRGKNIMGQLFVYKFQEDISKLEDIKKGKDSAESILRRNQDEEIDGLLNDYYDDYFYQRKKDMQYLCKHGNSLLDLLSENKKYNADKESIKLIQSFEEAADNFEALDNLTKLVCLFKGRAKRIIKKLNEVFSFKEKRRLIQELQRYSINIYQTQFDNMLYIHKAIHKVSDDLNIYYLDECYYDKNFGITEEATLNKGGMNV